MGDAVTVGVAGLGRIGGGVAAALARAGHSVAGYDVRPEVVRERGAVRAVSSPAALAAATEVVLVAVLDDRQVRDVLAGPEGLLSAADPAQTIVVLSTIELATLDWAASAASARGVAVVDCAVSGGVAAAEDGTLVGMVGGAPEAVASVRTVIAAFCSHVVEAGPLGAGMRLKLARNLITYGSWVVVDEAARLVAASGLDVSLLVEAVHASDPLTGGATGLVAGGSSARPSAGPLTAIARKDLAAAVALADGLGLEVPVARMTERRIQAAVARDWAADHDIEEEPVP